MFYNWEPFTLYPTTRPGNSTHQDLKPGLVVLETQRWSTTYTNGYLQGNTPNERCLWCWSYMCSRTWQRPNYTRTTKEQQKLCPCAVDLLPFCWALLVSSKRDCKCVWRQARCWADPRPCPPCVNKIADFARIISACKQAPTGTLWIWYNIGWGLSGF